LINLIQSHDVCTLHVTKLRPYGGATRQAWTPIVCPKLKLLIAVIAVKADLTDASTRTHPSVIATEGPVGAAHGTYAVAKEAEAVLIADANPFAHNHWAN
jgi:hypothetical protein